MPQELWWNIIVGRDKDFSTGNEQGRRELRILRDGHVKALIGSWLASRVMSVHYLERDDRRLLHRV